MTVSTKAELKVLKHNNEGLVWPQNCYTNLIDAS